MQHSGCPEYIMGSKFLQQSSLSYCTFWSSTWCRSISFFAFYFDCAVHLFFVMMRMHLLTILIGCSVLVSLVAYFVLYVQCCEVYSNKFWYCSCILFRPVYKPC